MRSPMNSPQATAQANNAGNGQRKLTARGFRADDRSAH